MQPDAARRYGPPNLGSAENRKSHSMTSKKIEKYTTERLQNWDANGWAVVALPAGFIAVREGRMLMKLGQADAERLAAVLNEELAGDA